MAVKLENGLYEVYLSAKGIYKMSLLILSIVQVYINYLAYLNFKQFAYELYQYQEVEIPKEDHNKRSNTYDL